MGVEREEGKSQRKERDGVEREEGMSQRKERDGVERKEGKSQRKERDGVEREEGKSQRKERDGVEREEGKSQRKERDKHSPEGRKHDLKRDSSKLSNDERDAKKRSKYNDRGHEKERLSSRGEDGRYSKKLKWDREKESRNRNANDRGSRCRNESMNHEEYKRYWGDNSNDKYVKDDDQKNLERTESSYLVGSRYYSEPERKSASAARSRGFNSKEPSKEFSKDGNVSSKAAPVKKNVDLITTKTGGAYIPPGKLRLMQASITDKSSAEYQRIAWEALKKSIHGHINKVNTSNIAVVSRLLFKENIVRGRGLLCRSIIQAQAASPTFTNVYACLVAIINSKFPNIGELLLKRVALRFKRAYKRNDKAACITSATFVAHLINQRVAHEILGLELLTLLVENPTDDSVEVAVAFLKECGQKLAEVSSKGSNAIFDMLRNILHEGKLEKRIQYMIEVMFQVRKDEFRSFPSVMEELDLVDEEDQFTHLMSLDDANDPQDLLNVFKMDDLYEANEEKYKELRNEILDTDNEESGSEKESSGDEEDEDESDDEDNEEKKMSIVDNTETNLVALRKTIYLTIQSSLDFEECAHKLLRMEIKPGQEQELCHMFLDCCAEQRTYEKFFGLLAQRFCQVNHVYVAPFEQIFSDSYATVHRLDTNKLRNVAKFFAHLLFTDAISWAVLQTVKLNEEDTTSSSRIFIKILFQELSEYMGLATLNSRLKDPTLQSAMEGLFPRDNPKNTRFAINFFTSIGLGGLTDELREHLKNLPKPVPMAQLVEEISSSSSDSSSSASSSSSSSSSEEESSSSDSSSSDSEEEKKKRNKKVTRKKNNINESKNEKNSREEENSRKKKSKVEKEDKRQRSTKEDKKEKDSEKTRKVESKKSNRNKR